MTTKWRMLTVAGLLVSLFSVPSFGDEAPVSEATETCLECHTMFHPGIVEDWRNSRHAAVTPGRALEVEGLARKISADAIPEELKGVSVGCAECHTLRNAAHADRFEHNGAEIHVVVTPADCAACHPEEQRQFSGNLMSHARANLADNTLYNALQRTIIGEPSVHGDGIAWAPSNEETQADSCYYCHGTVVAVRGLETRETDVGPLEFPVLTGWPNQGVGRVNPDGSLGSCAACHTRHQFSMEMARKPYTCKECHVGPDVPAFKVYMASKHGVQFSSLGHDWDFSAVPWKIGEDFTAPTCAACHMSLLVNGDGEVVSERTHQMNERLGYRIFGLVYAHNHPRSPDTTVIRNNDGLPLPTDFDGDPAVEYLIDDDTVARRMERMGTACLACHGASWVNGYFSRLENTIATSNAAVGTATALISEIWKNGMAEGPDRGGNPFDEYVERIWTDTWLLYANNVRFVAAMAGGGDYGVFEDGRYHLTRAILALQERLEQGRTAPPPAEPDGAEKNSKE